MSPIPGEDSEACITSSSEGAILLSTASTRPPLSCANAAAPLSCDDVAAPLHCDNALTLQLSLPPSQMNLTHRLSGFDRDDIHGLPLSDLVS
ncbi:hypothetical protein GBA52_016973 [Prunus armeniaca]|nr:hypothetical protein GBA52_016973 [Prunus armeniaca]